MSADSVADDMLRAGYERWLRLEEEKAAIGEDLKALFAELKGNGFAPKALRESFRRVRNINDANQQEHDAIVDLYVASLTGARPARTREGAVVTAPNVNVSAALSAKIGPESTAPENDDGQVARSVVVGSTDASGSTRQPVEHSEPQAIEPAQTVPASMPAQSSEAEPEAVESSATHQPEAAHGSPLYAAPGVVVMERCPPVGVIAHPFAACFPVNRIDAEGGIREPIVKIEQFILDGRGRYFAARDAGAEYPVVQYDGTDPLLDCIRWNLASREIAEQQRKIIAQKLCALEPSRADEIKAALQ